MKAIKKSLNKAISVLIAALMLICLMPATAFASPEASFKVRNNSGPGGDHGIILATYNGNSVTIDKDETHTFTYVQGEDSIRIDFIADPDYQFQYYVIGNGSRNIDENPSYFDAGDYIWKSGSNNTISLNPKWARINSYTIDTEVSAGGTITPDQTVSSGSDCTVTYSADRGYHLARVIADGADVTRSNPESYTFTHVTSDHSISVVFEADTYDIAYDLNGGTVSTPNPAEYTIETSPFTLNNPTRPGYEFTGWTGTGLSGNTLSVIVPTNEGGNRQYTANWNMTGYTVSFGEGDHGSTTGTKTFTGLHYGDPFPAAPEITPEAGWTFDGWPALPDTVTGDASYTAAYTRIDYTVTFNVGENGTTTDITTFSGLHYGDAFPAAPGVTPDPGWAFGGWTPALPEKILGNGTYGAYYTQQTYTVTWNNWDGSLLENDTDVEGGTMPSYDSAEPARPGTAQYDYIFNGWMPAVDAVTGDVTYTAQFTAVLKSYTVTWNNWDGSLLEQGTAVYGSMPGYGGAEPAKPGTAQYGCAFSGWSPEVDVVTENVTYTAQFTQVLRSYTVKWNNWDGSLLEQDTADYGVMQGYNGAEPARPDTAQYDYTFSGWSPEVDVVTGDVTYTAQFTSVLKSYTVTWNNWDSSLLEQDTADYGTMPNYDGTEPVRPDTAQYDYTFSGWSPAVGSVTGDVIYTARFTTVLRSYTVTFEDYNGTVLAACTVKYGERAAAPADPDNRTGYHFTGWDKDFGNITGPLTVKAKYAINSYRVRFFRVDGVTQIGTSQTINWGSGACIETAPAAAGKSFSGWKLKGDDPSAVTSLSSVKENIDATAVYDAELYSVTFIDYDGIELRVDKVPYGGDATPPADPSRDGYTFTGWSKSYDNITNKVTCVAQYTINMYTVTFTDYNGDLIDKQTVEWNAGADAPNGPSRDGYTFTGWDVPFDRITKDILVTAQYEGAEVPSPTPAAAPAPTPAVVINPEPVPQTDGGSGWLWWLLIPVIGILWILIAAKLSIIPIAEALSENKDGTYTVYWGYENRKHRKYKVADGKSVISLIKGKTMKNSAEPPVEFEKGRVENVFTTIVDKDAQVQWKINYRIAKVDIKKQK